MDQIGRYKIVAKIGQGATSHVYKGFDATLGRHVAIKIIATEISKDETLRKRFEREAQSAALLNHPHVVTIYDFGQEQDKLYIAMELLEGVDLKQALVEGRLKTLDEKLEVMEQIGDGLAFAHANGIIHRDLKPANIHLLPNGQVKIMDFGLARLSGSDMTRTGLVIGTPHYMSPEQVRGEHVDARSDVFSLGCVFYEILTGHKAFDAESLHSVLFKVMQVEPAPATEWAPGLPYIILLVLEKALAKRPSDRFQDAGEFRLFMDRARAALAAGRGNEALPGLERPVPAVSLPTSPPAAHPGPLPTQREGASPAPDTAWRRAERPSLSRPHVARHRSVVRPLLLVLGAFGLLAVAVAGALWALRANAPAPAASAPSSSGQVDALARMVVETQAELARRRLDAHDYNEAARQAERALKLDPENAAALDVLGKARRAQEQIRTAVDEARAALAEGDGKKAAEGFWTLLQISPDDPAAAELAPSVDAAFRARAEEARRLMTAARDAAQKAQHSRSDMIRDGDERSREGEAALQARTYAVAARHFMRARERFQRALR